MQLQQSDLYKKLREEEIASRDRIVTMVRPIDPAQLNEHPEPKGWSVAQVLEHLCLADRLYVKPVADLIAHNGPDAGAPAREWKSTIVGGLIASSLLNPKPIKRGPPSFRPGPTPRNGIVEAFNTNELRFLQTMEDASRHDWRGLRLRSPALPFFMPSMNLGDAFRIHVVHLTRHSRQIERLVKQL